MIFFKEKLINFNYTSYIKKRNNIRTVVEVLINTRCQQKISGDDIYIYTIYDLIKRWKYQNNKQNK